MKSKANIKGHPLHPILVGFPIAFFTATLLLDIYGLYVHDTLWQRFAGVAEAAGIVASLLAAVPGLIDYMFTIPPASSAKKRGATHGIINAVALALFVTAWFERQNGVLSLTWILALQLPAFILLAISGWLGSTLVTRNLISVDMRYAEAGKWKEAYFDKSAAPIEVASADELKTDQMKLLHVGGKRIVLARTENGYVAFDDSCTHRGGSLAAGLMICGTVQCPWHGSQFDCETGKVKAGPAEDAIKTYKVSQEAGKVYLQTA